MYDYDMYILEQLESLTSRIARGEIAVEQAKKLKRMKAVTKYEKALSEMKRRCNYLNQAYMLQRHLPALIADPEKTIQEIVMMKKEYFLINTMKEGEYQKYRKADEQVTKKDGQNEIVDACIIFTADYDFKNREQFFKDAERFLTATVRHVLKCLDKISEIPPSKNTSPKKTAN